MVVVDPDPGWPAEFEREAALVRTALGDRLVRLHHIGSTSVPGLAAKPRIDLSAEVVDVADLHREHAALTRVGFEYWGEYGIEGRCLFAHEELGDRMAANLHCFAADDIRVARYLALRDTLRTDEDVRDAYAALKRRLAEVHRDDRDAYTEAKTEFIRSIERRCGVWTDP